MSNRSRNITESRSIQRASRRTRVRATRSRQISQVWATRSRSNLDVRDVEAGGRHPGLRSRSAVPSDGQKKPSQTSYTCCDLRVVEVVAGEPGADRHRAAGPQPRWPPAAKNRGLSNRCSVHSTLHTTSNDSAARVRSAPRRHSETRCGRPTRCQRDESAAQWRCSGLIVMPTRLAAARLGQMNRRAAHAAADVEQPLPRRHLGQRRQPFGQLQLGGTRRFIGFPIAVVNVRPPQQSVERRRQIVVAANDALLDRWAGKHRRGVLGVKQGDLSSVQVSVAARSVRGRGDFLPLAWRIHKSPYTFTSSATPTAPNALVKGVMPNCDCSMLKPPRRWIQPFCSSASATTWIGCVTPCSVKSPCELVLRQPARAGLRQFREIVRTTNEAVG